MTCPGPRWIETPGKGRLLTTPHPDGGLYLEPEIISLKRAGADGVFSLLESREIQTLELADEGEVCEMHGMEYFNFPVPDHSVPHSHEALAAFLEPLSRRVEQGLHLVIHCWGGIGRSNLTACCLLILMGLDAEDALDRVRRAAGFHVPETREQEAWICTFGERFGRG